MIHTLLQADNFSPDALRIRDEVIAQGFATLKGPDGCMYPGSNPSIYPELIAAVERVIEHKIIPKLSGFRIHYEGEMPHNFIHSDDICARYASVLYLNLPHQCTGGTAFWKHTGLNTDQMSSLEAIQSSGMSVKWFLEVMQKEWADLTWWQQCGFVAMQFNRFITYPTCKFHSRYPFTGFGKTPADGRLVWVCFYDLAPEPVIEPAPVIAPPAVKKAARKRKAARV